MFSPPTHLWGDGKEFVYIGESRTTKLLSKCKVLLKLKSVPLLGDVGIKVPFESHKIVMKKTMILWAKIIVAKEM